jgi:hypothetical protein
MSHSRTALSTCNQLSSTFPQPRPTLLSCDLISGQGSCAWYSLRYVTLCSWNFVQVIPTNRMRQLTTFAKSTRIAMVIMSLALFRHTFKNLLVQNFGSANFLDFNKSGQKRIQEQVLQYMGQEVSNHTSVSSSVTTPSLVNQQGMLCGCGRGRGLGGGVILVADVVDLAAGTPLKRTMPISIQSNLPHITLQLGASLDCPNCPSIRCAVDSCAALMTGNFHFFAAVVKRFLHCIAKIFTPNDYAPIVLSGIVQSNAESVTTKLEVGFFFHLLYKTTDGDSASIMVATGPNVSINTIIGLPFMKTSGMILDLVDKVMECKYLNCPSFPVDF